MNLEELLSWETMRSGLLSWAPEIAAAVAILVLGFLGAKLLRRIFSKTLTRARVDVTLISFLANLLYALLLVLVLLAAVGTLGVNTTSFAAVLAAAGLAVGLALQGSLSNFAAGVMIIVLRPFKVGDVIDVQGSQAIVEGISIFATNLRSRDNKALVVPNSILTESTIINYTAKETRRVDLVFGIGYDDDIRKAKGILEKILADHPKVLAEPAPLVAVSELADSSVNFAVRPWCATEDYQGVLFDITEQVKLTFDAQGISIPFPQRDVHLHQVA
jgi:small conductance mechanosensitive channel